MCVQSDTKNNFFYMSDWDHDELEETETPPEGTEVEEDDVADETEEGDIPEGFTEVEEEPTF